MHMLHAQPCPDIEGGVNNALFYRKASRLLLLLVEFIEICYTCEDFESGLMHSGEKPKLALGSCLQVICEQAEGDVREEGSTCRPQSRPVQQG